MCSGWVQVWGGVGAFLARAGGGIEVAGRGFAGCFRQSRVGKWWSGLGQTAWHARVSIDIACEGYGEA